MTTDTRTMARTHDPVTSHLAAADAAKRRTIIRDCVLVVLTAEGPATHDQIIGRVRTRAATDPTWPRATDQGIRTRVHELVEDGLVEVVPDEHGRSATGRAAHLWRAVSVYSE